MGRTRQLVARWWPTQHRIEASLAGQLAVTAAMAVLVAGILAFNLPNGYLHDRLHPFAARVVFTTGTDQDWELFSPDPRAISINAFARVELASGETRTLHYPDSRHTWMQFRTYRTRKYIERVRADDYARMWPTTAGWFARRVHGKVDRVLLLRTFQDVEVPGSHRRPAPTQRYLYFQGTPP